MTRVRALLAVLLWGLFPVLAHGHALDPGFLEMTSVGHDQWRVTWRVPNISGKPMQITPVLPRNCAPASPTPLGFDGRAYSTTWLVTCPGGLTGGAISIDGLGATSTDTLVRYETATGTAQTKLLTGQEPGFTVAADPGRIEMFLSYVELGVVHILGGPDHLLFVLALVFLIRSRRRLFWAITAFTLAHSITLAAASLGWVNVPSPPVEVVIALSIVFLASELARPPDRRDPVAEQFPALVSFSFGLVHGLGFAGALREIGLPQGDIPLALLAFNVGVELGQLLFIAVVLTVMFIARKLVPRLAGEKPFLSRVASYSIGSVAAFWFIQRIASF